ncbi:MotA/TolQ/ExbB proton channel family protein [Marinobacter orientalis]|uniref:MotA/TolQ/ExbB proton channel family protein n=1 Tax=Marinobacter orientalis TaxID=1928859 RepID=A0A7Y0RBA3_9GAMM|nr:MotA/TolQ/ExbB proton channel family protein [Marinobacter orientalis]NMT62926.1 MotA/TolQ/ExbB proton channel family protein [Marinobacter orientalis]TGX51596.1 MotA/TolQ/ExbB proton channel family protein [Marinobacter orientalis]
MSDSLLTDATGMSTGPLSQLLEMGGPVMMVLLAIAVAGIVTFVYLMLFGAFFAPRFTARLKNAINLWQQKPCSEVPGRLEQNAGRYSRLNPLHHLVVNTMNARLKAADPQQIRESVASDAHDALEPFEAPLKIIEVIAALAPLLGLLGTVMGMMEAFSAMAATEGRANASQLSGGIYEALTTTAAGLVIAIPFAALAAWIEFRLRRIQKTINSALVSVMSVPLTTSESHAAPESPGTAADTAAAHHRFSDYSAAGQQGRLANATG